jgi:hypothetical protein
MKFLRLFFIASVLALIFSACSAPKNEIEDTYWTYWQACQDGNNDTAATFLTDDARTRTDIEGECMFTHDRINVIEGTIGGVEHSFPNDPDLKVYGTSASLIWIDDQGYMIVVSMLQVDGVWKIQNLYWSL